MWEMIWHLQECDWRQEHSRELKPPTGGGVDDANDDDDHDDHDDHDDDHMSFSVREDLS